VGPEIPENVFSSPVRELQNQTQHAAPVVPGLYYLIEIYFSK